MAAHPIEHVADGGIRRRRAAGAHAQAEQGLGGLVEVEHVGGADAEDDDGVGQAVDGRLRLLLRLEELAEAAPAVLIEPVGHGVELAAEVRDLVLPGEDGARLGIPLAEAAHGLAEHAEWTEQARGHGARRHEAEERHAERGDEDHEVESPGGAPRPVALGHHGVLVDRQHVVGGPLDSEEERLEFGEVGGGAFARGLGLEAVEGAAVSASSARAGDAWTRSRRAR